jgi:hypothetical protein
MVVEIVFLTIVHFLNITQLCSQLGENPLRKMSMWPISKTFYISGLVACLCLRHHFLNIYESIPADLGCILNLEQRTN